MAAVEGILILVFAVLVSAVLDQIVPKISLPLFQILIGVVIALFAVSPIDVSLDPEYFLLVFIAPLLFWESIECDKRNLLENKVSIISLAVGLVVCITLVVGFVLNLLVPSIPLAAAFALGAALGPTDAAAVQALKKEARFGKLAGSTLQGEALLNDASGVVSFQFAIAAVTTGAFSLFDASITFVFNFIGGIVLGVLIAVLCFWLTSKMRSVDLENVTVYVLFEISLPFITFMVAEHLGVSGILAVVACGIVWSLNSSRKLSPINSRLSITVSSVWKTIAFSLNGFVFVLLGTKLPEALTQTWLGPIDNFVLIGLIVVVTLLVVGIRFIWSLIMLRTVKNPETNKTEPFSKEMVWDAAIITIGGAKGTVTLSIVFAIPFFISPGVEFPNRSLLIFIAAGVIILTLLIANFALPLLSKQGEEPDSEEKENLYRVKIDILKKVIRKLIEESSEENLAETNAVIMSYNKRIEHIRDIADIKQPAENKLRIQIINYQIDHLIEASEKHEVNSYEAYVQMKRLYNAKIMLEDDREKGFSLYLHRRRLSNIGHSILYTILEALNLEDSSVISDERILVRQKTEEYALAFLYPLVGANKYPADIVAKQIIAHERALAIIDPNSGMGLIEADSKVCLNRMQEHALQIERAFIDEFYADGKITRTQSKEMKKSVSLMEVDLLEI